MEDYSVPPGKALVLRTCGQDGGSSHDFTWPESGPVECPDWSPEPECGHGLHGLLWGEGGGSYLSFDPDARWLIVEVEAATVVSIGGDKVKFPAGVVVHCGTRYSATRFLAEHAPAGSKIVGLIASVPDKAAHEGVDGATVAGGDGATLTAGYGGQATAGDSGQATAGYRGQATAGDRGQATAGYGGQATAGDRGQATAGYGGQATAGYRGQATAGDRGQATAGYSGTIAIRWWDDVAERYRLAVGYVGEDGIEPNVAYRVEGRGTLVKAD